VVSGWFACGGIVIGEEEIRRKLSVWQALSQIFLDTDPELNLPYVVRGCAESEFSIEELKFIYYQEVAPACLINLRVVAGEWAFFDDDWLIERISQKVRQRAWLPTFLKGIYKLGFSDYLDEYWQKIERQIRAARAS